ncbi:porin family protein [Haliangium ochraceum]|nr:porin family protein [Haliangium ochraceum]
MFALSTRADAEQFAFKPERGGLHLGFAGATVGGSDIAASDRERVPIGGLSAGGFFSVNVLHAANVFVGVQTELAYVPRGADIELEGMYRGGSQTTYLDFPILLRVSSERLGVARVHGVVGPVLSLLLSSKQISGDGSESDVRASTRSWDLGFTGGVEVSFPLNSRVEVGVEARYVHGFLTIASTQDAEILNRSVLVNLGVSILLGERAEQ